MYEILIALAVVSIIGALIVLWEIAEAITAYYLDNKK